MTARSTADTWRRRRARSGAADPGAGRGPGAGGVGRGVCALAGAGVMVDLVEPSEQRYLTLYEDLSQPAGDFWGDSTAAFGDKPVIHKAAIHCGSSYQLYVWGSPVDRPCDLRILSPYVLVPPCLGWGCGEGMAFPQLTGGRLRRPSFCRCAPSSPAQRRSEPSPCAKPRTAPSGWTQPVNQTPKITVCIYA